MTITSKEIDLKKSFSKSSSGFVRKLPSFVVRMVEKLVHQVELNDLIYRYRELSGVSFIDAVLDEWKVKLEITGGENLPLNGRLVFVANHPMGGTDALSIFSAVNHYYTDVISPSNEILLNIPNLSSLMLGVNVFGMNSKSTVEKFNQLFNSDSQIIIFPAGEVSRRKNGIISDVTWQKSFLTKAIAGKRDIVPVFISGRNSNLFYFTANIRKLFGIKTYIETALLPREMFRQKNTTIKIKFGIPVKYQELDNTRTHQEWAAYIKKLVYDLGNDVQ